MAELFGDPADFAIEAGVEPDLKPVSAVWGHMRVWCGGVPLGNINNSHCALLHSFTEFVWLATNLDSLWTTQLQGLHELAAWNFLDGLLYGYHDEIELQDDRTLEECQRDAEVWGKFNFLTNWGEQFDGYKSFLICPPGDVARVLFRRLSDGARSVQVSKRGFVAAAEGFAQWFDIESKRLGVPNKRKG